MFVNSTVKASDNKIVGTWLMGSEVLEMATIGWYL